MASPYDTYTSPLAERNASAEMLRLWSPRHKFSLWRKVWLAVAEAQHELGLPVTKEQVEELRANLEVTDEDMHRAEEYESRLRHDVMAHVHAWGERCPKAKGIVHLGMTSQDVNDNAELLICEQAYQLLSAKHRRLMVAFGELAQRWSTIPTLGFTHFQPAQPTTVGRRIAQWAYELHCARERGSWSWAAKYRGLRGATGTQAAFLALFNNVSEDVDRLESLFLHRFGELSESPSLRHERLTLLRKDEGVRLLHAKVKEAQARQDQPAIDRWTERLQEVASGPDGFFEIEALEDWRQASTFLLTTQTYPRVVDAETLSDLAGYACVLHKIATDIRLLCNRKELDEPFEKDQIGSSAMPYKRNPMRCERICGLSRFVMNLVGNAYDTAATQWLERTLDDSSNRRLSLPEAFLALDGALDLMHNVASGLIVHQATVRANLMAELPFMATENILMAAVKAGGDRQEVHEAIRKHAQEAGWRVKEEGKPNDLLDRLRGEPLLAGVDLDAAMDPMAYIGRSVEQTERFIKEVVEPLREQYGERIAGLGESEPRV